MIDDFTREHCFFLCFNFELEKPLKTFSSKIQQKKTPCNMRYANEFVVVVKFYSRISSLCPFATIKLIGSTLVVVVVFK